MLHHGRLSQNTENTLHEPLNMQTTKLQCLLYAQSKKSSAQLITSDEEAKRTYIHSGMSVASTGLS